MFLFRNREFFDTKVGHNYSTIDINYPIHHQALTEKNVLSVH